MPNSFPKVSSHTMSQELASFFREAPKGEIERYLVTISPDSSGQDPDGWDLLHWRGEGKFSESPRVNVQSEYGTTPLHIFVNYRDADLVTLALGIGADPEMHDKLGRTALHSAITHGRIEAAEILIRAKANLKARDIDGQTPLHLATEVYFNNLAMIEALCRAGADIRAKNDKNKTPVELAEEFNNSVNLKALAKYGAAPIRKKPL